MLGRCGAGETNASGSVWTTFLQTSVQFGCSLGRDNPRGTQRCASLIPLPPVPGPPLPLGLLTDPFGGFSAELVAPALLVVCQLRRARRVRDSRGW